MDIHTRTIGRLIKPKGVRMQFYAIEIARYVLYLNVTRNQEPVI